MRLLAVIAFIVPSLLAGAGGIALGAAPSQVHRQVATPQPELCTPVNATSETRWLMPAYDAQIADGSPDELSYRCDIDPGAAIASHDHSGWFLLSVQSGSISFTVDEGIMWAHCTPDCGTSRPPGSAGEETLLPGATVTLMPGDWVLQDRATTHAFRNETLGENVTYLTAFGVSPLNGDGGCRGAC